MFFQPRVLVLLATTTISVPNIKGQSYQDAYTLEQTLFTGYKPSIRPLQDQSQKIVIRPHFSIGTLGHVDELKQSFVLNGFLNLEWQDELLRWDPNDYNGVRKISPEPTSLWRPRFVLLNTLNKRDLFEDRYAPTSVSYDGRVVWSPGGRFPASCHLNLRAFPYDTHSCGLILWPMYIDSDEMEYDLAADALDLSIILPNGGWSVESASMRGFNANSGFANRTALHIGIKIKRKPWFWLITVLFPVILLCALDALVFAIPVESGEKVNFSAAVVLAFSVYMTIVSEKLPPNSDTMAYFTYYIFLLFGMSLVTSVDAIFIVWMYYREVDNSKNQTGTLTAVMTRLLSNVRIFCLTKFTSHSKRLDELNSRTIPSTTNDAAPSVKYSTSGPWDGNQDCPHPHRAMVPTMQNRPTVRLFRNSKVVPTSDDDVDDKASSSPHVEYGEAYDDKPGSRRYKDIAQTINFISFVVFCSLSIFTSLMFLFYMI